MEYKDSLSDPDWTVLPDGVSGNGNMVTLTNVITIDQRFYRVREQ